jgi:hypothetical protein
MKISRALSALAALSVVLMAWPAGSGLPTRLRLDYVGYLTGTQVLTARLDVQLAGRPGSYQLNMASGLIGTLGQLVPFQMSASSQGHDGASGPRPGRYRSEITIYEDRQIVTLTYGANGVVELRDQPRTDEGRRAIARGLLGGTVDPLTAALAITDNVGRTGRCGGVVRIFDGARRYDLTLAPAPAGIRLPQLPVAGTAIPIACDARISLVSGFPQSALDAGMYPTTARFWLAQGVAGPRPTLLRIEAESGLGQLRLDLQAVFPGS